MALHRQPVHDGDRRLQHARAAAHLRARRQRLDRLLGTLWPGHLPYSIPMSAWTSSGSCSSRPTAASGQQTLRLTRQSAERGPMRVLRRTFAGRRARSSTSALNVQGSNDNYAYLDTPTSSASRRSRARRAEIERQRAEELRPEGRRPALARRRLRVREAGPREGRDGDLAGRPELQQRAAPRRPARSTTPSPTTSTPFAARRWLSPARSRWFTATATTSRSTSR